MRTYKLKPQFTLTSEEVGQYNNLPENLPDNTLNAKEEDFVTSLYYRYTTRNIDNQSWSKDMYKVEKEEKWPSGPRVKDHEAKRMILSNLVYLNTRPELTMEEAASLFHNCLTLRPMFSKLVYNVYSCDL